MDNLLSTIFKWSQLTFDSEDRIVSAPDSSFFLSKIDILEQKQSDIPACLCFRGVNLDFLKTHFCADSDEKIYKALFCVGEKGRAFLDRTNAQLNSCDSDMLRYIFMAISEDICFASYLTPFRAYFEDTANIDKFITAVDNDLHIRDYYLAYLHKMGSSTLPSFFVSTSDDPRGTEGFAEGCGKKLCYIYVEPLSLSSEAGRSIDSQNEDYKKFINKKLSEKKLPLHERLPYEGENETIVFAGILPHLLWCIADLTNKKLIVNPALFNTALEKIYLNIDQRNFEEFLNENTFYTNSFTRWRNGNTTLNN